MHFLHKMEHLNQMASKKRRKDRLFRWLIKKIAYFCRKQQKKERKMCGRRLCRAPNRAFSHFQSKFCVVSLRFSFHFSFLKIRLPSCVWPLRVHRGPRETRAQKKNGPQASHSISLAVSFPSGVALWGSVSLQDTTSLASLRCDSLRRDRAHSIFYFSFEVERRAHKKGLTT